MFFSDKINLIMRGRGVNMAEGWETKRRRDPGPDWSIVKLAATGSVRKVIIDTCHFKGNFPDTFLLEGLLVIAMTSLMVGQVSLGRQLLQKLSFLRTVSICSPKKLLPTSNKPLPTYV